MSDANSVLSTIANGVEAIKSWFDWLLHFSFLKTVFSGTGLGLALGIVQPLVSHLIDAMQGVKTEVTGVSSSFGTTDASFLEHVNYFMPIDSLASCVVLYIGIYCAVQMARLWSKVFGVTGQVVEKIPVVQ